MRYSVVLQHGAKHGFAVQVPELPGCNSAGETVEEALANARDAIEVHLLGFLDEGEPMPEETEPVLFGHVDVDLDALRHRWEREHAKPA